MSDYFSTPEEVQDAKQELDRAVKKFRAVLDGPAAYVDAWVLVSHVMSPEDEAQQQSRASLIEATGQSFIMTRGLLHVGIDTVTQGA